MQHLDDGAVAGHRAARREGDASTVAAKTSARISEPASDHGAAPSARKPLEPAAMVVEAAPGTCFGERLRAAPRDRAPRRRRASRRSAAGSAVRRAIESAAEPRLEQRARFRLGDRAYVAATPERLRGDLDGARDGRVDVAAGAPGVTWMVTSRAISDCQSLRALGDEDDRAGRQAGEERS